MNQSKKNSPNHIQKLKRSGAIRVDVEKLARKYDNPALAKESGHVYQLWQDGEITLQKSGDLLWQRNLHTMVSASGRLKKNYEFPHKLGNNSYIFCTDDHAYELRALMLKP